MIQIEIYLRRKLKKIIRYSYLKQKVQPETEARNKVYTSDGESGLFSLSSMLDFIRSHILWENTDRSRWRPILHPRLSIKAYSLE